MNERDVNGAQGNRAVEGDAPDESALDGGGRDAPDVEDLRRLRLNGFLRELVRAEGRMEAAELLGVNYRTLVKAEESGEITGRMGDALERLLRTEDGPEMERLLASVGALEERVATLEGGLEELRGVVYGGASAGMGDASAGIAGEQGEGPVTDAGTVTEEQAGGQVRGGNEDGAGRSETRAAPPGAGRRPPRPERLRRADPEVVTEHPAGDDEEVYGAVWPLVEEWRRLRAGHPHQGQSLSWLKTQERLLVLELAMLEENGLTLPPETQALRGFGRRGQTSWRWKALADTQRALRRRVLLRWARRACTLGLWWK